MCMPHSVVCGLSDSTMLFHIISWTAWFSEKKIIQHKCKVLIFFYKFRRCISHSEELSKIWSIIYIVLHVNYTLLLSDFLKTSSFSVDLWEILIKFHENPSSVSRVVPCGRGEGQMHRHDKINSRFRNLAYAPIHCRLRLKCDGTRAETRLRRNGRVHLNRRGCQFRRLPTTKVCTAAVVILDTPKFNV